MPDINTQHIIEATRSLANAAHRAVAQRAAELRHAQQLTEWKQVNSISLSLRSVLDTLDRTAALSLDHRTPSLDPDTTYPEGCDPGLVELLRSVIAQYESADDHIRILGICVPRHELGGELPDLAESDSASEPL